MAEENITLISEKYAESNLIERGEYTELENKVNGNTTSITDLGNTVNTVKGDVDDLKPKVATLEQSVESNSQAITTLEQDVAKKQDNVGLSVNDDGNLMLDLMGITQCGGPFENSFDGYTKFYSGVEIQGKKPVLDVTSSDGSVTVTRSGDGDSVDLKAKSGGSTDNNPRFRIVTWNVNDSMASFGKLPARPEDATFGNITLEQFNSGCQSICPSAFAVALNEYTWLVTRGEGMWNDNDFGVFCWSGLKHTKDDYECHYCDLPESTLPL